MKKIIMAALSIIICVQSYAQIIQPDFSIEAGIAVNGSYALNYEHDGNEDYLMYPLFLKFSPEARLFDNLVHVYGSATINMYKLNNSYMFLPVSIKSVFGASINYKGFYIIFEHMCKHPIIAYDKIIFAEQTENSSYTQISLKYTTEGK